MKPMQSIRSLLRDKFSLILTEKLLVSDKEAVALFLQHLLHKRKMKRGYCKFGLAAAPLQYFLKNLLYLKDFFVAIFLRTCYNSTTCYISP